MLQWGHRFTSVETRRPLHLHRFPLRASMGPPIYIGGNSAISSRLQLPPSRFNGATDLHRWKPPRRDWPLRSCRRFNGATDLHRWKRKKTYDYCHTVFKLQWGHRFTSVETSRFSDESGTFSLASMGPPIYIGGNLPQRSTTAYYLPELQWGHRFTSVETIAPSSHQLWRDALQWGHRFTSVETGSDNVFKWQTWGFNGATDLHRWKPPCGTNKGEQHHASMGPPIYIGGNFIRFRDGIRKRIRFNGATDLHRWKLYL